MLMGCLSTAVAKRMKRSLMFHVNIIYFYELESP